MVMMQSFTRESPALVAASFSRLRLHNLHLTQVTSQRRVAS